MFEITKTFEFSAAHSVFSQQLDPRWSVSTYPKCRRLPGHGHNYKVSVTLASDKLDGSEMVTDFNHLSWFKIFLKNFFDHKLIVSIKDGAGILMLKKLGVLKGTKITLPKFKRKLPKVVALYMDREYNVKREEIKSEIPYSDKLLMTFSSFELEKAFGGLIVEIDMYQRLFEGITLFYASPTSENFAKLFYEFINKKISPLGVRCSRVGVSENVGAWAEFRGT